MMKAVTEEISADSALSETYPKVKKVTLQLFHASDVIKGIKDIAFPGPRINCDFGSGFYLADNMQTAQEWVIDSQTPIINSYVFNAVESDILHLTGEAWIKVIIGFRAKKYKVKFKSPIIRGTIADDRMVPSLALFFSGTIGDLRLFKCLNYCKLGDQFLLRNSTESLSNHTCKELNGEELRMAFERFSARRRGMARDLQLIQRESIPGEKFIEHYLAGGDFIEK